MICECKIPKFSRLRRKYHGVPIGTPAVRAKPSEHISDLDCTLVRSRLACYKPPAFRQSSKVRPMAAAFNLLSGGRGSGGANNAWATLVRTPVRECDNSPFGRYYRADAKYMLSKM